jgi:ABC-type phosphate transport system auxiliary subunit
VSSPHSRIKIRCPNCQMDGSAKPELLNRRVSCKHCSHVFRVIPIDSEIPIPGAGMSVSSASAIVAGSPAVETLRTELEMAQRIARKAEDREATLRKELDQLRDQLEQTRDTTSNKVGNGPLDEELRFLRDQLDKARLDGENEARKRREATSTLTARTAEHVEALQNLRRQFETAAIEAQARSTAELGSLREELRQSQAELVEAKQTLETAVLGRDTMLVEHSRALEASKREQSQLQARLAEAEASRTHRDQLARELETVQKRAVETERHASEHKQAIETIRLDHQKLDAERLEEISGLRDQLAKVLAGSADAAILRQELDEVRLDRDRLAGELEDLRVKVIESEDRDYDMGYPSTELEIPHMVDPTEAAPSALPDEESTVFDPSPLNTRADAEIESLKAELADLTERLDEKQVESAELIDRAKGETMAFRRELYETRLELENATRMNRGMVDRVREIEAAAAAAPIEPEAPAIDPGWVEAERRKAVEDAVKAAWADFERRLAETQAKLKAANIRADMMEAEAREIREQVAARERAFDQVGDGSSFGGEIPQLTSLRILEARGTARITPADAEARLGLARQIAVDRKDKALIDRIGKMTEKVRADLEARNYTLAETLVRGAEIEAGLDPGGFSINGLRMFRASPTIVGSLEALAPSFDRVMRVGDLDAIRSTIAEARTILGDQAGLPEILRPGRIPTTRRPIAQADAFRLFIDVLISESWLVKPVVQKKPLPDTSLSTYASLIEGACVAWKLAETLDPDQVSFLDELVQACCLMVTRRQQPDGHFAFIDPRGKASKAARVVEGMVAQRSDAVKDGWVIHVDPIGTAQIETGACAMALATAGDVFGREPWTQAAKKATEWAVGQPCLPNFVATAASASLVARAYIDTGQEPDLVGLVRKLSMGLLPGQAPNGRWIDPVSATTSNHLLILRALHWAWQAIPEDRKQLRKDLKAGIDRAMGSLLEECKALGVPSQGSALRDLIHHRDLFSSDLEADPRLEAAILDSVTTIQELCHDGAKAKLGVAANQLAALMEL